MLSNAFNSISSWRSYRATPLLRLNKLPRRDLAAPYLCLIAAAWSLTSTQDKIKQFHRQISYGCRNGETMYNNLNNWIRSLKEEDWFNPDEKMY